jgi:hypothetical protein
VEFFVWAIVIFIALFLLAVPLAILVMGLAYVIGIIQKTFNIRS